jgi:predicted metal-dependent phosphoesterase TrpH
MNAPSSGAKFFKSDLHTHTPASTDFVDAAASPDQIIEAAQKAGIEILAITDHNATDWIDRVRAAAKGSSVTIVPGVEITTPEGHILALFEPNADVTKITDLLITIGIPREKHGREEAVSELHVEAVISEVRKAGGLAIAAHANENNGLLNTKGQYKMTVVPKPELIALELTKQEEIERFCAGKVSPDYPPNACTYSSDSHGLSQIGRRITYLNLNPA